MKHLDMIVMHNPYRHCILKSKNHIKAYTSQQAMIADVSMWDSFVSTGRKLYNDFLHPSIAPFNEWVIDNFKMVVEEMGYQIIVAD